MRSLFPIPAARCALATLTVWMAATTPLMAQLPPEETPEKGYVPSYLIISFAVGLGLMMICRAGKRTVEFRRD